MSCVVVGTTLLFLLCFFNRFAGLRSGDGEYACGIALLSGVLPYRDYYVTAPPLNILKAALLLKAFGPSLIVLRIAGVAERALIALLLFRWLARIFRPWHAMTAAIVTIIVSSGDRSDPIASYNHDAIFFALLAGYAASLALDARSWTRSVLFGVLAGAATGLSLLTKQTVGAGALLCVLAAGALLTAKLHGTRRAVLWTACFTAGCSAPLAAVALWLFRIHMLGAFVQMLFVKGPAAKAGNLMDLLLREFTVARGNPVWLSLAVIALALSWRALQRGSKHLGVPPGHAAGSWDAVRPVFWVLAAGVLAIGSAAALSYTSLSALHDFSKSSVYYVLLGLTAWLAVNGVRAFRSGFDRGAAQAMLFAALAWSIAAMLSLSWPAFETIALPGLGFLLAAALDGVTPRLKWFPLLVMAAMVFIQVREKLDMPFGFNHQDEAAVRLAGAASSQPRLRGLRLPPATVAFLDGTVSTIRARTRTGDTIFTYPEMALFYALSGRQPPTFATSHNIDVVSDAFAREEAAGLRRERPAVIVYYRLSELDLRQDELTWRNGDRSGQRDLIAAVEGLVSGYRLAGTYVVAPGDPPIEVYVRP